MGLNFSSVVLGPSGNTCRAGKPLTDDTPRGRLTEDMLCTGQGESRGIKGQVQQLLQDAQDPDKLCKMYVGWSAWL